MNSVWSRAIQRSADPERARRFVDLLRPVAGDSFEKCSAEQANVLTSLFSGSQVAGNLLERHPDWLSSLEPERLKYPRRKQGLRKELAPQVATWLEQSDFAKALASVRTFKQREMVRIAARDLARFGTAPEITQEIADVADVCLGAIWDITHRQLTGRYGSPYHQDPAGRWHPTAGCVLGMGKLGGQELNYSSDVDVLFVYAEEGSVFRSAPGKSRASQALMKNHQFFNRLAESFIAEVARLAPEGTLYRIDLRLRPEGDIGPLSRALASYENYYAQWGQTWERMMLLKTRAVGGDEGLGAEFLEMVQPFRYPRSVNEGVLREVAGMKDRIEREVVKAGELERNVKLGYGGIREIEFIVQALQLLHAGRQPFLQGSRTLPGLAKLAQYELLPIEQANALTEAYCFLRDVEHRLQMEDNRQTHTIPTARAAQERLARLMGFATLPKFESALKRHTGEVRRIFDKLLKAEVEDKKGGTALPPQFEGAEAEWKELLAKHRFRDVEKGFKMLREFVEGPGFGHVSPRTAELGLRLLPRLFDLCIRTTPEQQGKGLIAGEESRARLSDPDRVLTRLDVFIGAYGARATLFELWNSNPAIFDLLLLLFDRSEFLAELAIRTPELVDELVSSGRLRQRKGAEEVLRDLRHGLEDKDQHLWMRRYHQAELMRVALRDILGLAHFEQYLTELSALADASLRYALEVVMKNHRLKKPPFAIIGLGKLGGAEIDYGSDLDILFVAGSRASKLPSLAQMAIEVMDLVSRRTEQGLLFHTDARLRPDGEKGLLVNTLDHYETYYRQRSQLWEIQSLSRSRAIAGDSRVGEAFQNLATKLCNFQQPSLPLAAFQNGWKQAIHKMRLRIEKERTKPGADALAIKTGAGGLMDAEFIAQALCLEHGWHEPNSLRALERGKQAGVLPLVDKLIDSYRRLRRVEGILRRWSYEGETTLPDEPAPFCRVSVRCGFDEPEAFRKAVAEWRRAIREAYERVFGKKQASGNGVKLKS